MNEHTMENTVDGGIVYKICGNMLNEILITSHYMQN